MLRREHFLLFLSPLVLVCLGVGLVQVSRRTYTRDAEEVPGDALYREVMDVVRERYVIEMDDETLIYGAVQGIMDQLDPHSRIYTPEEWEKQQLTSGGHYVGIGVQVDRLRGRMSVLEVLPGGPAERAGVRHGDTIVAIDGAPVNHGTSSKSVGELLEGPSGSIVKLTLAGVLDGLERTVGVKRGLAPSRVVYGYLLDPDQGIGYVHIDRFRATTVEMFDREMRRLVEEGLTSLVLDLRGNLGGSLDAAVQIADRFIPDGYIVTTVARTPRRPRRATAETPFEGMPTIVLTDIQCASASEVLAGALQDHSRALLAGERTYGKGVVQEVAAFARSGYSGGYKITTAHYFTPAGRCIERQVALGEDRRRRGGLVPDIPVPMTPRFDNRAERAVWYGRRDDNRQRGRYAAVVRRILEKEREPFEDVQIATARAVLAPNWSGDRPLTDG